MATFDHYGYDQGQVFTGDDQTPRSDDHSPLPAYDEADQEIARTCPNCAAQNTILLRALVWPHTVYSYDQNNLQSYFADKACTRCGQPLFIPAI